MGVELDEAWGQCQCATPGQQHPELPAAANGSLDKGTNVRS
jgi:hypothetical protein